jgi:adenine-specific DNA-methyltransferase
MAEDLKNTRQGQDFFGEPDIIPEKHGKLCIKVNGVDVFKPQTTSVTSLTLHLSAILA